MILGVCCFQSYPGFSRGFAPAREWSNLYFFWKSETILMIPKKAKKTMRGGCFDLRKSFLYVSCTNFLAFWDVGRVMHNKFSWKFRHDGSNSFLAFFNMIPELEKRNYRKISTQLWAGANPRNIEKAGNEVSCPTSHTISALRFEVTNWSVKKIVVFMDGYGPERANAVSAMASDLPIHAPQLSTLPH